MDIFVFIHDFDALAENYNAIFHRFPLSLTERLEASLQILIGELSLLAIHRLFTHQANSPWLVQLALDAQSGQSGTRILLESFISSPAF
jgi:hypothetical protein